MSFYCMQKWNHAVKATTSTNVCMSPQKEFFFPDALFFYKDSPFGVFHCFPR